MRWENRKANNASQKEARGHLVWPFALRSVRASGMEKHKWWLQWLHDHKKTTESLMYHGMPL